jgi:hypothetical protein
VGVFLSYQPHSAAGWELWGKSMNARLVFACAATGIAMTFFGAATATADEANKGSIGFGEFNKAGRGEPVEIYGTCDDPDFTTTPVVSDILDAPDLYGTDDGIGGYLLKSFGKVKDDAPYGTWPVHFMCGTTKVESTFTVVARVEPFIEVTSDTALTPGAKVTVTARCADLEFAGSTITSPALTAGDLVAGPGWTPDDALVATGRINSDAKPGMHDIAFTCGEGESNGSFTVVAGTAPVVPVAQVPVKPKGAADTGSLETASINAASDQGPGIGVFALGGVALLGAAGGLVAYRRRQRA